MRKVGVWVLLLVLSALAVWSWGQSSALQALLSGRGAASMVASATAIAPPTINPDRLLKDVAELSYRRFEEGDRRRAQDYIVKALTEAGWNVQLQPFERESASHHVARGLKQGTNIVAERPGTDPAAGTILLGGHFDTVERSPGTDDNATAVATVLEAARLLGSRPTPRSLQLVLFDLEEIGLLGSKAFVDALPGSGRIDGAVILDMIGYGCYTDGCQSYPPVLPVKPPTTRGDFLAVIGDQGHQKLIDAFPQASRSGLTPVLTLSVPFLPGMAPDLIRSDHKPFWEAGTGAVLVTDTANFRNPHYHQPEDTFDNLDVNFFRGSAQVVINAVTTLLESSEPLAGA
jgi:Zn-dependent M28 family amino/carboxypeptidase